MTEEAAELPAEVDRIDALELENLQLRTEKAQATFERAVAAFQSKFESLGEKYKFDFKKDVVNFDTRKIERR